MKIIDITRELLSSPVYPGDPTPSLNKVLDIKTGDPCNLTTLSLCVHNGTHIDAPLHFIIDGKDASQIDLDCCYGIAQVAECDEHLTAAILKKLLIKDLKRLIIKGDGTLTAEGAAFLVDSGIKLFGTERMTVGLPLEQEITHKILFHAGVAVLENITLQDAAPGIYTICALPLKITGCEGSPVRAILIQTEE